MTLVSAIIINTEKGNEVFNNISKDIEYKECKMEEIVSGNPSLKTSGKEPKTTSNFLKELDNLSISILTKKYQKKISLLSKIKRKIKSLIKIGNK